MAALAVLCVDKNPRPARLVPAISFRENGDTQEMTNASERGNRPVK